jgi:hypothetical protein
MLRRLLLGPTAGNSVIVALGAPLGVGDGVGDVAGVAVGAGVGVATLPDAVKSANAYGVFGWKVMLYGTEGMVHVVSVPPIVTGPTIVDQPFAFRHGLSVVAACGDECTCENDEETGEPCAAFPRIKTEHASTPLKRKHPAVRSRRRA